MHINEILKSPSSHTIDWVSLIDIDADQIYIKSHTAVGKYTISFLVIPLHKSWDEDHHLLVYFDHYPGWDTNEIDASDPQIAHAVAQILGETFGLEPSKITLYSGWDPDVDPSICIAYESNIIKWVFNKWQRVKKTVDFNTEPDEFEAIRRVTVSPHNYRKIINPSPAVQIAALQNDPGVIYDMGEVFDEVWKDPKVKQAVMRKLMILVKATHATYDGSSYLEELIRLGCPWPEVAAVKNRLADRNVDI